MQYLELVKQRFSVRSYTPTPVEEDKLQEILEAGRLAPSAANRQPCSLVVVRDERKRRALGEAYPRDWFWSAPVIIVVCVEPARAWVRADGKNFANVDGAIMMDHLTLSAASLGLGTCWIGAFEPAKVKRVLALPDGVEPLVMTPLGYSSEPLRVKSRKPSSEVIHLDSW
jgi:nitroreductase